MNSVSIRSSLAEPIGSLKKVYFEKGYFRPAYGRAFAHALSLVFLLLIAFWFVAFAKPVTMLLSIMLMGLYYPQAAYLAHELGHVRYFKNLRLNDFFGTMVGCAQGLSFTWWRHHHNIHHSHVNEYRMVDGRACPIEHGIDGAPFLLWDFQLVSPEVLAKYRWWIRLQPFTFWPIISLVRINWIKKSLEYTWRQGNYVEFVFIILHYILMYYVAFILTGSHGVAAFWLMASNLLGSFLFTLALVANHTCKEIRLENKDLDFFERQLNSTRNLPNSFFLNWFMGALNLQIEHHFFPKMPMYNLKRVAAEVKQAVKSSGLNYDEKSFLEVIKIIYREIPR